MVAPHPGRQPSAPRPNPSPCTHRLGSQSPRNGVNQCTQLSRMRHFGMKHRPMTMENNAARPHGFGLAVRHVEAPQKMGADKTEYRLVLFCFFRRSLAQWVFDRRQPNPLAIIQTRSYHNRLPCSMKAARRTCVRVALRAKRGANKCSARARKPNERYACKKPSRHASDAWTYSARLSSIGPHSERPPFAPDPLLLFTERNATVAAGQ